MLEMDGDGSGEVDFDEFYDWWAKDDKGGSSGKVPATARAAAASTAAAPPHHHRADQRASCASCATRLTGRTSIAAPS
eukprot:SAG11_NODE_1096_length_5884_cov_4.310631_2_plen_78_part_00